MKVLLVTISMFCAVLVYGQYTTPDAGLTINLDYLVENSEGAVTQIGDAYVISEGIIIAPSDVFEQTNTAMVLLAEEVLFTVQGGFILNAEGILFDWLNEGEHYDGFRFETESQVILNNAVFQHGGGLRVLTEDFVMNNCVITGQTNIASTSGALGLFSGKPVITNSVFSGNESAAISSAINIAAAPLIENCIFVNNGTSVINQPQINLGPSGADTTIIRNNIIEGDPANVLSGGIGISSLTNLDAHAIIEENTISGNRYGIAVLGGNLNSLIKNNIITDNNIENLPMMGGSGINLNSASSNHAVITGNQISGNLWGITLQGTASANLGDLTIESPGGNTFEDNGNEGVVYALFNNTANDIMAMNNCWDGENNLTEEEAEALITHQVDDSELGLVTFMPVGICNTVGVEEMETAGMQLYPNPATTQLVVTATNISQIMILDMTGKVMTDLTVSSAAREQLINVADFSAGLYVVRVMANDEIITSRFIKQ